MKRDETVKSLLKSIKSRRLHKLIKAILLLSFIYLSFLVVLSLKDYFLQEMKIIKIEKSGFKVELQGKILKIEADNFYLQKRNLGLELENASAEIDIVKSIRELRIHLNKLMIGNLWISRKTGKKKEETKLPIPPISVDVLKVGNFLFQEGNTQISAKEINLNSHSVSIGGIYIKTDKHYIELPVLKGTVKEKWVDIPHFWLTLDKNEVTGELSFTKDLEQLTFKGTISGESFTFKGTVKKDNRKIGISGNLSTKNLIFSLTAKGRLLSLSSFQLERARLSNSTVDLTLSGSFTKNGFSLTGKVQAKKIETPSINIQGIEANFSAIGNYINPSASVNLKCSRVDTPLINLKELRIQGEGDRKNFSITATSDKIKASIVYADGNLSGKVSVEKFPLKELKPVAEAKKHYGRWIPNINLDLEGSFTYKKGNLNYNGSATFREFFFRGFRGTGRGKFSGNMKKLNFMLYLRNGRSVLNSGGEIDIARKTIRASFNGDYLELSSIDFLKNIGLKGSVTGGGELHGKLKNPTGYFEFSAFGLEVHKGKIGLAEGNVRVENRTLHVSAKSEDGSIKIEEIKIGLKKPTPVLIKGKTDNIPISTVFKVLKGYGIELPLKASGTLTGSFEIQSDDVKDKNSFYAHVEIDQGEGKAVIGNKIQITFDNLTGSINFSNSTPEANLSANLRESQIENIILSDGNITFTLQDKTIKVVFLKIRSTEIKNNSISGKLSIEIPTKSLKGQVEVGFKHTLEKFSIEGKIKSKIKGKIDSFLMKIEGKLKISSPILKNAPSFVISGTLEEPSGFGNVGLKWKDNNLRLLIFKNRFNLVGTLKQIQLKFKKASVNVKFAFVNLDLNSLSGDISIPAFEIKPDKFYKLYSISGIYITLKKGTPQVSNTRLSYVDGWIELLKIKTENGTFSGKFKSELGAKGLVYLSSLKDEIKFIKGKLKVRGTFFKKEEELNYTILFSSENLFGKVNYLLEKFEIEKLSGRIKDGKLESFTFEANVGDGNIVATKTDNSIVISLSEIPVGMINSWKTLTSGNLILTGKKLIGKLNLYRTILILSRLKSTKTESKVLKFPVETEISLNFLEPVRIDSDLFWFKVMPKLKIHGNGEGIKLGGNFFLTEGAINYMGKKFKVVYGTGVIENLTKLKGSVDILANAYISGYYIYMNIKGSISSPQLFLTSDPPLTREQILNLIMTGATPMQIEESAEIFPAVQVAYYATASLFKPIEQQFRKAFKLESFNIEPYITKYGETVAKVSLAKRLSKRIRLIGYETTGQNPEYGGSIQIFLTDRYYLETKYNSYYGPEIGVGFELNLR